MTSNLLTYKNFVRNNLPSGMTISDQYFFVNDKRFTNYINAEWYLNYITKFGYSTGLDFLFTNDEPGVWFDPSPETCYTDTAGTTPAAVGQAVALMLDKSKGLVLGPELAPQTIGGYTNERDASLSTVDGNLRVTGTGTSFPYANGAITTEIGKRYLLVSDATLVSGVVDETVIALYAAVTGGAAIHTTLRKNGRLELRFVATRTSYFMRLVAGDGVTSSANFTFPSVRELPGHHATQLVVAKRPILRQAGALYYLEFDGVDDAMETPLITPGTDKVQVFAGVRKLSDAAQAALVDLTNNGAGSGIFGMQAPPSSPSTRKYLIFSGGTSIQSAETGDASFAAPTTNVITGLGDISGDLATLRIDGTQVAQSTANQGAGNYLAYPMYIGARAGTSLFFNGHLYSLIARFGPNLDATTIGNVEAYTAGKTGVTL